MNHSRRLIALAILTTIISQFSLAQTSRTYINLRTVFGDYLSKVDPADLAVTIDEKSLPIKSVEIATGPINYCIVLDLNAWEEPEFERLKALAQQFLASVPAAGRDRVCLVLFDATTLNTEKFTSDFAPLKTKLANAKWSGAHGGRRTVSLSPEIVQAMRDPERWDTPTGLRRMLDVAPWMTSKGLAAGLLHSAALHQRNSDDFARVTVVFSDGDWVESIPDTLRVMKAQQFTRVRVFTVGLQKTGRAAKVAANRLDLLAQGSGGMSYFVAGNGPELPSLDGLKKRLANTLQVTCDVPPLTCDSPHDFIWHYMPDKTVKISAPQAIYCAKPAP